jgi:hypothetical protein
MKIRFASKVILFQKTLEHCNAINLCYGRQKNQEFQGHVSNAHIWAVCNVVDKIMLHVVKQCILNQTQGYWLLSNALNATLSINVCMQNQIQQYNITPFEGGF